MKKTKKLESLKKMQTDMRSVKGGIAIYDYEMFDNHNTTIHSPTHNGAIFGGDSSTSHVTCDHTEKSDGVNHG